MLFCFVFWYVFIPCREVQGMLWGDTCMRKSEPVFPTLTDVFRNPLICISVSFPVMVLMLLQTHRLPCFPFTWLQEAVLPSKLCTSCSSHHGCRSCRVPQTQARFLPPYLACAKASSSTSPASVKPRHNYTVSITGPVP